MFERLSPQKARNIKYGYVVQSEDRFHLKYIDGTKSALVEVEDGASLALYRESLTKWVDGNNISTEDREIVLSRVASAVRFWGMRVEIC